MVLLMSGTVRRHFLREKEARQLLLDFSQKFNVDIEGLFGARPRVEVTEIQTTEIITINGKPVLARLDGSLLPTLIFEAIFPFLPKIVVNMGAVPYICNGADVMAPGVVRIDGEFKETNFLLIVDERYEKSLGIGVALFNSQAMRRLKKGKIVKNLHFVGDKLWNFMKTLT